MSAVSFLADPGDSHPRADSITQREGEYTLTDSVGVTHTFKVEPLSVGSHHSYLWALIPLVACCAFAAMAFTAPASTLGQRLAGGICLLGGGLLLSGACVKRLHTLNKEISSLNREITAAQSEGDSLVDVLKEGISCGHYRRNDLLTFFESFGNQKYNIINE